MPNIVTLDSAHHRHLRLIAKPLGRGCAAERFSPIVTVEIPLLAGDVPILLSKDPETGRFFCGAMLGIDPGEDLFDGPEGITLGHCPLDRTRTGFYIGEAGLAVDLDSPRVTADLDGDALFTPDGEPASPLQRIIAALGTFRAGIEPTEAFIHMVLDHKLVEPVDIGLSFDDGSRRTLQGLYTISQDRLRGLDDEAIVDLFHRGYLQLIYLIIASFRNIARLATIKNARLAGDAAPLGAGVL